MSMTLISSCICDLQIPSTTRGIDLREVGEQQISFKLNQASIRIFELEQPGKEKKDDMDTWPLIVYHGSPNT